MQTNKKKSKHWHLFEKLKHPHVYISTFIIVLLLAIMSIQIIIQNMIITIDIAEKVEPTLTTVAENKIVATTIKNSHKEIYIEEITDVINEEEDEEIPVIIYTDPLLCTDRYTLISLTAFEIELDIDADIDEEYVLAVPEIDSEFIYYTTYKDYDNGNTKTLPMSERGQKILYNMTQKYNLPYKTVLALLGVETHWNEDPDHVERGIYIGIGCVNKNYHAKKFADRGIDIYTLEGNIEAICYLLRESRDLFNGSMTYAIMGYNGGNGYAGSQRSDGITETSYTKKVVWYANSFK